MSDKTHKADADDTVAADTATNETELPVAQAEEYLRAENGEGLLALLTELHVSDAADLIQQLSASDRREVFVISKGHLNPGILTYLDEQVREDLFQSLSDKEIAALLDHLESDDALEVIENLDEARQFTLLRAIPASDRAIYVEGLTWPEDSAGRLMRREVVTIPRFWTVGQIIDHLRDKKTETPEHFHNIIVVGPQHKPVGMVSLARLARNVRATPVGKIMQKELEPIVADTPQEEVAKNFVKYGYVEMPVTDHEGRLLGTITLDDIVFVLQDEHKDDLLKLGGVIADDFYSDILATIRSRFSWLAVNLLTAILASLVIALFETALQRVVALAILMPIVASMGGNAGTQALTVAVRALATGELTPNNALRVIYKEVFVGSMNGVIFAVMGGGLSWFWFNDVMIGVVIGLALVVNLVIAGLAGAGIPLLLDRLGADPAISSSVFLTTVTDVIGFFAFLGLAVLILL